MTELAPPSDNNPAERSLRPLVISRKISGGTRSEQGTETKMALASLFGTWRAQGLNPLWPAANSSFPLKSEQLRRDSQGNHILIDFILAPNHHPEPLTLHPEPVEGPCSQPSS